MSFCFRRRRRFVTKDVSWLVDVCLVMFQFLVRAVAIFVGDENF
jgi:hypothetical protein